MNREKRSLIYLTRGAFFMNVIILHRNLFAILLFLSLSLGIAAQETTPLPDAVEDVVVGKEYKQGVGLENWTYNYDISDYPDGEYNLIIRSTDKVGNVTIAEPINIFIDFESDLPIASISNSSEHLRVGGMQ